MVWPLGNQPSLKLQSRKMSTLLFDQSSNHASGFLSFRQNTSNVSFLSYNKKVWFESDLLLSVVHATAYKILS